MFIQTETTPNPASLKFLPGRIVLGNGTAKFRDSAEAGASPLAERLFAVPGVPMIYSGQEFGEDAPRTIDFCPINWDKLKRTAHHEHYDLVCRLIRARRTLAALRNDNIHFEADDFAGEQVVRLRRWDEEGTTVLAALNFADERRTVTLHVPTDGVWRDVVADRVYQLAAGEHRFVLQPWRAMLLAPINGR